MSERVEKIKRHKRERMVRSAFKFTHEEFNQKKETDSTMQHILAMSEIDFRLFIAAVVKRTEQGTQPLGEAEPA